MFTTGSVLSTSFIHKIGLKYSFSATAILAQPRDGDRACSPPRGFVTIYEDHLVSGLRFPFPSIYHEIYEKFGISPSQFYPNGILQIAGLGMLCTRLALPFTAETFGLMYSFKARKGGWYLVSARHNFKVESPSKVPDWYKRFFFGKRVLPNS